MPLVDIKASSRREIAACSALPWHPLGVASTISTWANCCTGSRSALSVNGLRPPTSPTALIGLGLAAIGLIGVCSSPSRNRPSLTMSAVAERYSAMRQPPARTQAGRRFPLGFSLTPQSVQQTSQVRLISRSFGKPHAIAGNGEDLRAAHMLSPVLPTNIGWRGHPERWAILCASSRSCPREHACARVRGLTYNLMDLPLNR